MNTPFMLFAGLLGLAAGSFCAAASWRYVRGISVVFPRSACPRCGRKLTVQELVPLLGYALLRGRCAGCKQHISVRYPLMESLYAATAVLLAFEYGPSPAFAVLFCYAGLMLAASAIDAETFILPDCLTLPAAATAVPCAVLWLGRSFEDSAAGLLLGAGIPFLLRFAMQKLRGREGLGLGDVKYMAALGGLCGVMGLPTLYLGSALPALAWLAVVRVFSNKAVADLPIPFGPFLSLGAMLTLLWGDQFWLWWLMKPII